MVLSHETYMQRCLQLARLGGVHVAPNPMVGAVLVHEGRIIGEGYHRQYGGPHAEVNCLASVQREDRPLIGRSMLYVSLEPCAHYGKTPPCTKLIIENHIPRVVVGCRDPFIAVNGKGIEQLKAAGVEVITGICEEACQALNKRFFTFHMQHRPYIVLKWAQTADAKIAGTTGSRLQISHPYTNRLVHRWRSEEAAILVGTHTALLDDPALTARLWPGSHPVRLVVDVNLRLPHALQLFDGTVPTVIFNRLRHSLPMEGDAMAARQPGVHYYQVTEDVSLAAQMVQALYRLQLSSVLVEGGRYLLQSFIDEGAWDEARVITNESMVAPGGLPAPVLAGQAPLQQERIGSDILRTYRQPAANALH